MNRRSFLSGFMLGTAGSLAASAKAWYTVPSSASSEPAPCVKPTNNPTYDTTLIQVDYKAMRNQLINELQQEFEYQMQLQTQLQTREYEQ